MIGTFILTFMVFALAVDKRAPKHIYGIGIGAALGVSVLAFGKVSGAALNPTRWLGPAIIMGAWEDVWLYTIGPISGACLAGALYQWVLMKPEDERVVQKAADFD
jgi:glycerol uptake facilitator-like aquaporin